MDRTEIKQKLEARMDALADGLKKSVRKDWISKQAWFKEGYDSLMPLLLDALEALEFYGDTSQWVSTKKHSTDASIFA